MTREVIEVQNQQQLDACFAIRRKVFIEEQNVPEHIEIDDYDRLDSSAYHVLLLDKGQPVATGRITTYTDGSAKMQRVAVLPDYRKGGYGSSLMNGMEDCARSHGYIRAILDAQCHAEGFYDRLGYRTISAEPFDDAGIPHVRMIKDL
ncbi:GNAT family N-acetyltransferase [Paenibacillus shenyangensis]|uniref:GNAT family N-acetyltransferase n=1 Tax=Paenibacillus sp. A9 TaxID=1284352 RepID=UPI00035C4BF2|nr:GNAT family N-acetyltransferase [Paenibacillus sp. A9]